MANKDKDTDCIELVETHKPKNFKFKYIIKDENLINELIEKDYDISSLDTIRNDDLVNAALKANFKEYDRSIIGKAKQPTVFEDGTMISKMMVTKADKKLRKVHVGLFGYELNRMVIKLEYEKFDIIEIFNVI